MHRLFVYGTLKRGDCRHHAIADQQFLGSATTESAYRLYDFGDYPALVACEDGVAVGGELYQVDDACLETLDVIEGVAQSLYARKPVELLPPWHDQQAITYLYQQSIVGQTEITHWPAK